MGDPMRVLEKRLLEVQQRKSPRAPALPRVRPNAIDAARRRSLGEADWARRERAARRIYKLPPLPARVLSEMTHGVANQYRFPTDRLLLPLPPPEPVMTSPIERDGRRVDKPAWFAHGGA